MHWLSRETFAGNHRFSYIHIYIYSHGISPNHGIYFSMKDGCFLYHFPFNQAIDSRCLDPGETTMAFMLEATTFFDR